MSTVLGASQKRSILLLEFKYENPASPTILRLAQFDSDLLLGNDTWQSQPEIEINPSEISGLLNDKALNVTGPLTAGDGLFDQFSNGEPVSPVDIRLLEHLKGTESQPDTTLVLFKGRLSRVSRNYQRQNWVLLEAKSIKARLDRPLGIPANYQCVWQFGGRGCGATVPSQNSVISSVAGKVVTTAGLSPGFSGYWRRGYAIYRGLSIPIQDYTTGNVVALSKQPPASWVGASVKFVAGCNKTIEQCRVWGREAQFMGFGYAIPAYSPNYEVL